MRIQLLALIGVAAVYAACGGDGDGDGGGGPSTNTLAKAPTGNGDNQTGTVNLALANPFCAQVTQSGSGQSGVTVNWSTPSGGTMSVPSSVSGADGVACSKLTLGTTAGSQTAQAAVTGATGSPVTFNATANPANATTLVKGGGDNQSGDINTALSEPLTVTVADPFGNGVSNALVTWDVSSGSATLDPVSGNTNSTGLASTTVTLGGTAGAIVITASAAGLVGSPQTFNATADTPVPPPNAITIQVDNNSFTPGIDTVAVGGTVTWNWAATSLGHSVTSTGSPSFTSDPDGISNGPKTYAFTFNTPGTYLYYCLAHGSAGPPPTGMSGTIVVK
jgi:plastocyanin